MEFRANDGKNVEIQAMGRTWARHAIQTHTRRGTSSP